MKTKKDILFLTENGLSLSTISSFSDRQVKILVEKFKRENKEQTQVVTQVYDTKNPEDVKNLNQALKEPSKLQGQSIQVKETEMTEDETDDLTTSNALGKDAEQAYTGQEAPHDANDMADDGMGDDSGEDRSMMGMAESEISEKFESKAQQGLFWARCNKCSSKNCKWCKMAKEFSDSTSKKQYKNMPEKKHPEKTVKKNTNENFKKFLEKKISEMVDNNIDAKMSKKDLIETIKKKSKSMIIRRPKKVSMFSHEAPMELPIAKMFSIGKK
jgi:DnaJ-domain-containing protein 1